LIEGLNSPSKELGVIRNEALALLENGPTKAKVARWCEPRDQKC